MFHENSVFVGHWRLGQSPSHLLPRGWGQGCEKFLLQAHGWLCGHHQLLFWSYLGSTRSPHWPELRSDWTKDDTPLLSCLSLGRSQEAVHQALRVKAKRTFLTTPCNHLGREGSLPQKGPEVQVSVGCVTLWPQAVEPFAFCEVIHCTGACVSDSGGLRSHEDISMWQNSREIG